MSQYFVGQRVKTIAARNPVFKRMIGKEGTITRIYESIIHHENMYVVDIDGHGTQWNVDTPGRDCGWSGDHIVPITPPHEPGSWEAIDKLLPHLREQEKEPA